MRSADLDLVGAKVYSEVKHGRDVGALAGRDPVGVLATCDTAEAIAMEADCVHFAPLVYDLDMVCRLLRSGKNVVSPLGPFYPWERWKPHFEKIAAACKDTDRMC